MPILLVDTFKYSAAYLSLKITKQFFFDEDKYLYYLNSFSAVNGSAWG